MVKCSFCGGEVALGGGKLYAKKDGTAFFFCSTKCEKNLVKLGRKPTKTKWTEAHKKKKEGTMAAKAKKEVM